MKKNNKEVRPSYTDIVEAVERGEELPTVVPVYARTSKPIVNSNTSVTFERQQDTIHNMVMEDAVKKIKEIEERNIIKKGVGARTKAEREYLEANSYTYYKPTKCRVVDNSLTPIIIEYGRVSLFKDDGLSSTFGRQSDSILSLKKSDGNDKYQSLVFEDEGISAYHAKQRAGLDTAIKFIEEFKGANPIFLYIEHIDRYVRKKKVSNIIFEILKTQKVNLRIVNMSNVNLAADDMMSNMMLDMAVAMAESYSTAIASKTTGGHKRRVKDGLWRNSVAPYGMEVGKKIVDGTERSVLKPGEHADIVRQIFDKINKGDSTNDIVRWLNNSGIKAPGVAEIWRDSTITFMLLNPHYAGYIRYNSAREFKKYQVKEQIAKDENGNYIIAHEGIVTPEVFWTTFVILTSRHKPVAKSRNTYLLSGILYCTDCGAKLYGNKSSVSSYRCPDATRDSKLASNSISCEGIEEVIKRFAKEIISNAGKLKEFTTKPTLNTEEIDQAKKLILDEIAEIEIDIANEKRPSRLIGLKAALIDATSKLERLNTNSEINIRFASKALVSEEAFEEMWTSKNKTAIILALKSFIERIDVEPLGDRKKLNTVLLAKKGWLFDYTRVSITWSNGITIKLSEEFDKANEVLYK